MDRLIWDNRVISAMADQLSRAANDLADSRHNLKGLQTEAEMLLSGNGPQSEQILEQLSMAISKLERAQEESNGLSVRVRRAQEMMETAERSIVDMAQRNLQTAASEQPAAAVQSTHHRRYQVTRLAFSEINLVPAWLEQAAAQYF